MRSEAEFLDWLLDARRNDHRLVLVEIDHREGTVRLATRDWQSDRADGYRPYDGWLVERLVFDDDVENFRGTGMVKAINAAGDVDWTALQLRGHPVRWLVGDDAWPRAEFRPVLTAIVDECLPVRGRLAQFDLSNAGDPFNRRPAAADEVRTGEAEPVIASLVSDAGGGAGLLFTRVPLAAKRRQVSVKLTADTTLAAALLQIVESIGAYARFSHKGDVEVFVPSTTAELRVTRDDIALGGIRTAEVVPAYAHVRVEWGDEQSVTRPTGTYTGLYRETVAFASALTTEADATALANARVQRFRVPHARRELRLRAVAHLLQVGTVLDIEHDDYTGRAMVTSVRRELLGRFSTVTVET